MKQMSVLVILVTPQLALEWLKTNSTNRQLSQTNILKYANDILNGRWFLTHQGIAFDTDGNLRDGQHRLIAIYITGKPVLMSVAHDVPKEAFVAVDNGKNRDVRDHEQYAGNPLPKEYMPTLRGMLYSEGRRTKISSNTCWSIVMRQYDAAVKFTIDCFGQDGTIRGLKSGMIMGAFARAYYSQDHAKLSEFAKILTTGLPNGGYADETILRFRNWRIGSPHARPSEVYRKSERTIQAFVGGERLIKVYEAAEELFAIPPIKEEGYIPEVGPQLKQLQQLLLSLQNSQQKIA